MYGIWMVVTSYFFIITIRYLYPLSSIQLILLPLFMYRTFFVVYI